MNVKIVILLNVLRKITNLLLAVAGYHAVSAMFFFFYLQNVSTTNCRNLKYT